MKIKKKMFRRGLSLSRGSNTASNKNSLTKKSKLNDQKHSFFSFWNKLSTLAKVTLIVFIITSILRLYLAIISAPLNGTDSTQIVSARYIAEQKNIPIEMPTQRGYFEYTPLYHVISAFLYSLLNFIFPPIAFVGLKILPAICAIGIVVLTYFIVRSKFDEKIALITTLFLSCVGMLFQAGSYTALDIEAGFFVVLSLFFLLKRKLVLSSLVLALGFYAKFNAAIYLIVPVFFLFFCQKSPFFDKAKKIAIYCFLFFLLISPWFLYSYVQTKNPFYPFFSDSIGCCSSKAFDAFEPKVFNQAVLARQIIATFGVVSTENMDINTPIPFFIPPDDIKEVIHFDNWLLIPSFYVYFYSVLLFFVPLLLFGFYMLYKKDKNFFWFSIFVVFASELLVGYILFKYYGAVATRYVIPALFIFAFVWSFGLYYFLKSKFKMWIKVLFCVFCAGILLFNVLFMAGSISFVKYKFSLDFPMYDFVKEKYAKNTYFYGTIDTFTYYTHMYNTPFLDVLIENNGIIPVQKNFTKSGVWYFPNGIPKELEGCLVLDSSFDVFSFYKIENASRCVDINSLQRKCGKTCS